MLILLSILAPLWFVCGCNPKPILDTVKDVTNQSLIALDEGIKDLGNSSADWQKVLQDTVKKLSADTQSTIRHEVSDTLTRATAAAGSQVLCIHDVVKSRVRQDLIRIRASLLGGKIEPREPWLCHVVPSAVDLALEPNRRNMVEFFGYDFDATPIQALLVSSTGTTDVSQFLDRQTHYHMTLNLSGSGVQLSPESRKIVLKWNDLENSSVSVLRPQTPICETRTPPGIFLKAITFRPPHTGGDTEFDGHGPAVSASVSLSKTDGRHVEATITMSARETQRDWTAASGSKTETLYTPDPGWIVERIIGVLEDNFAYSDHDTRPDPFQRGSGGPVSRYEFVGDSDGGDAGIRTQVVVHFNPLRLVLKQTGDCISPISLFQLKQQRRISPSTLERVAPQMRSFSRSGLSERFLRVPAQ